MKTIIINEDNHGMIGVVMTYDTAIEFLTRYGWLDGNCEVSADPNGNWLTLLDIYGKRWLEAVLAWDVNAFNEVFFLYSILENMTNPIIIVALITETEKPVI